MLDLQSLNVWLGTEESFHTTMQAYAKMDAGLNEDYRKECFSHDEDAEKDEEGNNHFLLELVDNVGLVTVHGSLVAGSEGSWGYYWGIIGYDDIRNALITAVHAGVERILIDYDTPGGSVKGIMELSDFIKSLDIPVTSFTGGMAASGGLWLATASDDFYAARMAEVGSLGVIAVTTEMTELYKEMGISLKVFKSTPLKAAGNPYEKLTKEASDLIQGNIDETHQFFVKEIALNRGLTEEYVSENIANGKVWYAAEANQLNLIDGIKTFDEILLVLMRETTDNANNFQQIQDNDMAKRKIISEQQSAAIASGASVEEVLDATAEETAVETTVETPATDKVVEETTPKVEESDNSEWEAHLKERVAKLEDDNIELKVELRTLKAKEASNESNQKGLMQVTAVAVQRCHVAIGSPAPTLEGLVALDASALLQQHALVDAQVSERFGAGKQISTTVQEDEDDAVAAAAKVTNDILLKQARIK